MCSSLNNSAANLQGTSQTKFGAMQVSFQPTILVKQKYISINATVDSVSNGNLSLYSSYLWL